MLTPSQKNRNTALSLLALVAGMVMLAYASVPLYRMFCDYTGYGGTTRDATILPSKIYAREVEVLFDAQAMPELPWDFAPLQRKVRVKIGQQKLVFFRVTNRGSQALEGVSTFNVTPHEVGQYFVKVKCFCYENQRVEPGQTLEMPVSFFIDPALLENHDLDELSTITLSYTFFKVRK